MKAIFFLFFCGLSFTLGEFNCNQDYPRECFEVFADNFPGYGPETEDALGHFCKFTQPALSKCQFDFAIECQRTLTGFKYQAMLEYLSFFKRICNKNDVLQNKYLEKIKCLNDEKDSVEKKCQKELKEQDDFSCKRSFELLTCSKDELLQKCCGGDVKELLEGLFKPQYTLEKTHCLSTDGHQ